MGMGLVPQGQHLFSWLTVKKNLIMAAGSAEKVRVRSLNKVYSFFQVFIEEE
jgi:ABC-type branched-subunit amino acid transport system ATPase component